jgi:endoglucanase
MGLKRLGVAVAAGVILLASTIAGAATTWPAWERFADRFLQADGRVIDLTFGGKSTSEGQAYGLFFALVANDRQRFDAILGWTSDNLAAGRLGEQLPAWLWGLRDDGSWGVRDSNAAADADLWLAYVLLDAARLWLEPRYAVTGRQLLARIQQHEVVKAGAAGTLLLPGPVGFALGGGRFRINPSYLPGFLFRYLALTDPAGPWQSTWETYLRLAPAMFAAGVAPDLVVVDSRGSVFPDTERTPSGSYDAIRVYLWAGMSGPDGAAHIRLLAPFAAHIRRLGVPPETVNPDTGRATRADYSPMGYSGAVLPFLSRLGDRPTLDAQRKRLQAAARAASLGAATNYYDEALILFGQGWLDGQYAFDDRGQLEPAWAGKPVTSPSPQ